MLLAQLNHKTQPLIDAIQLDSTIENTIDRIVYPLTSIDADDAIIVK